MSSDIKRFVTSLAISTRLKELGCKQDSIFYWIKDLNGENLRIVKLSKHNMPIDGDDALFCSAYTVGELGEILEHEVPEYDYSNELWYFNGFGNKIETIYIDEYIKTEANARGTILIKKLEL